MQNNSTTINTQNRTLPAIFPEIFPLKTETKLPRILEKNVMNMCPDCEKIIYSNLLEIDGKVYLEKNCCTKELAHIENDAEFFIKHKKCLEVTPFVANPKNIKELMLKSPSHPLLRLQITTKCNMKCPICYFKNDRRFRPEDPGPSLEQIKEELKKYKSREVYLEGAEATMINNLPQIIKAVKDSGNIPGMGTNGLMLEDKNYLKRLKRAGLKFIVFQFDGFNRKANIRFRGKDYLENKLKALKNIEEVGGFRVALASAIEKGVNEDEIPKIIQFALKNPFIDKIYFSGMVIPDNPAITGYYPTAHSDIAKALEKYGFLDREYFLEMVKMNRNVHEVTRKIFERTLLENWILAKLPDDFNLACLFKKKKSAPELLFSKSKIKKINAVLEEILDKNNRPEVLFNLLKNAPILINSPLWKMAISRFFASVKQSPKISGALEVFIQRPQPTKYALLNGRRTEDMKSKLILIVAGFFAHFDPQTPYM